MRKHYSYEFKEWMAPGMVSLMKMYLVDNVDDKDKVRWGLDKTTIKSSPDADAPALSFRVATSSYIGEVLVTYDWDGDFYHIALPSIGKTTVASCGAQLYPIVDALLASSEKIPEEDERQMFYSILSRAGNFNVQLGRRK